LGKIRTEGAFPKREPAPRPIHLPASRTGPPRLPLDPLLSRAVPQAVPSISSALLFSPQIRQLGVNPSAAKDPGIRANEYPARRPKILIANPELEFPASPTKQTTEPKSNRKKIAIFSARHGAVHSQLPVSRPSASREPRTTEFLIATVNISKIRLTPAAATLTYFLTATKQRFCQIPELRALACLQSASVIISKSVEI